jgi:hypothetical protein
MDMSLLASNVQIDPEIQFPAEVDIESGEAREYRSWKA